MQTSVRTEGGGYCSLTGKEKLRHGLQLQGSACTNNYFSGSTLSTTILQMVGVIKRTGNRIILALFECIVQEIKYYYDNFLHSPYYSLVSHSQPDLCRCKRLAIAIHTTNYSWSGMKRIVYLYLCSYMQANLTIPATRVKSA